MLKNQDWDTGTYKLMEDYYLDEELECFELEKAKRLIEKIGVQNYLNQQI